jgi:NAD(P)-dependent dehydrogenase (short-subunit alcohol dehydrogenase family)
MASGDPVAVVTGDGRGIGAGISKALAQHGFNVVIGWTSDEAAAVKTAGVIAETTAAQPVLVRGDVSDSQTPTDLADAALTEFGRLDCWVNNAGYREAGSILKLTGDQLRRCFETLH